MFKLDYLPKEVRIILVQTRELGNLMNRPVYIVGGFVRDYMLGHISHDIDLLVEEDKIHFAIQLNNILNGKLVTYPKFRAATINLSNGYNLDIISARREYYERPGAMPITSKGSIYDDLYRRDFTINCLAVSINSDSFGDLLDYFGGLYDLKNKKIKILHDSSFYDDPSRIFRAIRFASKFNFNIDNHTALLLEEAIAKKVLLQISRDRIYNEISLILKDSNYIESLILMEAYGILANLNINFSLDKKTVKKLRQLNKTMNYFKGHKFNSNNIIILQLLDNTLPDQWKPILNYFSLNDKNSDKILYILKNKEYTYKILKQDKVNRLALYSCLNDFDLDALIFYYNECSNINIKKHIWDYISNLKDIAINMTGEDLLELGLIPGPIYSKMFVEILRAKIMGEIYSYEDEIKYAKKMIEDQKGGYNPNPFSC